MNISLERRRLRWASWPYSSCCLESGSCSYRSTTDLIDREVRVAQTHQVRETIEHLLSMMEDLESTQRIDLLTGESQYVQLYREMGQSMEEALRSLTDLTSDNQTQPQHLLALRTSDRSEIGTTQRTCSTYEMPERLTRRS